MCLCFLRTLIEYGTLTQFFAMPAVPLIGKTIYQYIYIISLDIRRYSDQLYLSLMVIMYQLYLSLNQNGNYVSICFPFALWVADRRQANEI